MRKEMTSKPIATASNTTNIQAHTKQDEYVIEAWSCLVSHSISMLVWKQHIISTLAVFCHCLLPSVTQLPLLSVTGVYQCVSCLVVWCMVVLSCPVLSCPVVSCRVVSRSIHVLLCPCIQCLVRLSIVVTCIIMSSYIHVSWWCGVVWCGVVWYGVVCGATKCSLVSFLAGGSD